MVAKSDRAVLRYIDGRAPRHCDHRGRPGGPREAALADGALDNKTKELVALAPDSPRIAMHAWDFTPRHS